jgi:hypothetical protein
LARDEYRLSSRLPGRRAPARAGRKALLVSLALHLLIALAWRVEVRLSPPDRTAPRSIVLLPDAAAGAQHDLPRPAPPTSARTTSTADAPPAAPARRPPAEPPSRRAAEAPGARTLDQPVGPIAGAAPGDTGGRGAAGRAGLRPRQGDGSVWVEPYPETPAELADRVRRSHGQLVDSAVTAIVQAYLDSLALEPGADRAQLPSWVADIGGKQYGLDAQYIYVAGLKIPSAVLALIPFPQGNVDQALANRRLQDLRADLFQAAQRAENAAEFKKAIRDIRERKVQEEEFERNRRTPPDEAPAP